MSVFYFPSLFIFLDFHLKGTMQYFSLHIIYFSQPYGLSVSHTVSQMTQAYLSLCHSNIVLYVNIMFSISIHLLVDL